MSTATCWWIPIWAGSSPSFFSIYSIAVVAIFTGVIAGFYVEIMKLRAHESATEFLDELECLPELSHEELVSLSERAKKFRIK